MSELVGLLATVFDVISDGVSEAGSVHSTMEKLSVLALLSQLNSASANVHQPVPKDQLWIFASKVYQPVNRFRPTYTSKNFGQRVNQTQHTPRTGLVPFSPLQYSSPPIHALLSYSFFNTFSFKYLQIEFPTKTFMDNAIPAFPSYFHNSNSIS